MLKNILDNKLNKSYINHLISNNLSLMSNKNKCIRSLIS